jgi:hypothetical protein
MLLTGQPFSLRKLLCLLAVLLLNACGPAIQPDLKRLYQLRDAAEQPPVIIVPGILGSRLAMSDSGREVWPGSLWKLMFSDYQQLRLHIDSRHPAPVLGLQQVTGITDQVAGRDFYGSIISILRDAAGYAPGVAGEPAQPGQRRYYVFAYDWRQDNQKSAVKLGELIDQIRLDYNNPELRVDIIAHCMGGLGTRYYLRYGAMDVLNRNDFPMTLEGANKVRRVVLLGTPSMGSVNSIRSFIRGFDVGLTKVPTEILATFPSIYQLFPHALVNWIVSGSGRPLQRDIYSRRIWERFQWSVFNPQVQQKVLQRFKDPQTGQKYLQDLQDFFAVQLERARRFSWSLTIPMAEVPYQMVVFGGDCSLTPTRIVVEKTSDDFAVRLWPDEVKNRIAGVDYDQIMLEPGDSTVTKASLLGRVTLDPSVARHEYSFFPARYPIFVCEDHENLTQNVTFQDNLLHFLLSRDNTAP